MTNINSHILVPTRNSEQAEAKPALGSNHRQMWTVTISKCQVCSQFSKKRDAKIFTDATLPIMTQ